jgi:hypothetical protein
MPIDGARIRRRAGLPGDIEFAALSRQRIPRDSRTREAEALLESVPANYERTYDMIIRIRRLRERTNPA